MGIHAILQECVDLNWYNGKEYDLRTPWPHGEHIYATDGRIMARCPLDGNATPLADGRKVVDVTQITQHEGVPLRAVPLPDAVEHKPCAECGGSGLIVSGQCQCGCGQPIMRNGQPVAYDCDQCRGKGAETNDAPVLVAESPRIYLAAHFVGLLRRHGVGEVMVPTIPSKGMTKPAAACRFHGDGFDGWVMPMDTKGVEKDIRKAGGEIPTLAEPKP